MNAGGLAGFRVLDLSWHVAGPYCTKLLAGFGAEVIKIERPGVGDPTRRFALAPDQEVHAERGSLFLHLNTGKKSITLDLKKIEGRRLLLQLVGLSDAVVESFSPRVLPGLGLGFEVLRSLHPSLVMTSVSSFGQTGPYRDYRATDMVCLALGGLLYLVGEPDREPLKPWGPQASYQAGLHAAVATLTALYQREEAGVGEHVDVSVMESVAFQMHSYPQMYRYHGKIVRREGQRIAGHGPTGHYPDTTLPCQDGFVHVGSSGYHWEDVALLMEEPRLADPALKAAQRAQAAEIDALMQPWLSSHDKLEIFHRAQALRMPFAPVLSVGEVLQDEQLGQRGYFQEASHPVAGLVRQPGPPARLSESPWTTSAAPLLGEHNEEIYGGLLGYDSGEVARLRDGGVI